MMRLRSLSRRDTLHRLDGGAAIPGLVLRAGIPALAILAVSVFGFNGFALGLLLAIATAAMIAPRSMAAWGVMMLVVLAMLLSEPDPGRTTVMLLIVHALHVLGALSLVIPARSRVQVRALLPTLRRFAGVQIAAQTIVLAAASLTGGVDGALPWLAPLGALGLLVLTAIVVRRLRH